MIEDGAFSFCSSLADVSIPESVTVIGTDAFYSCSNLKSVTLSSAVTSIESHVFGYYMTDNAEYAGIPGFEVKGYAGTAAQQYANSNGFTFTDLTPQKEPETETPTAAKTNISAASVSGVMDKTYTGAALEQSFTVKVGTAALTKGTDYSVSYSGNVKAGSGYVTVIGKGNFCGSKRIKFSIARADIRKASIKGLQASYPYTGKAVRPKITVRMNGKDLNKGNEYTLKYKNNSKPGNASVIIKGKKNYTGTKLLYFRILKPSIKYRVYTKEEKESNYVKNGSIAGKDKINATVESFEAQLTTAPCKGKIKYKSYVSEQGWGKWKDGGKWCGGKDKSLQIEAIQMILTDTMAKKYDIYYRVRTEKFGWMGWAKNGKSSGSEGYNSPIQAIEIQVVLKGHEKPVVYPLGGHKNAFEYKAP